VNLLDAAGRARWRASASSCRPTKPMPPKMTAERKGDTVFKKGSGDWTKYRGDGVREVDFHRSTTGSRYRPAFDYREAMAEVEGDALDALRSAHSQGVTTVLFIHGWSTSRPGRTTSRSVIRNLMRSKEATPYIRRSHCIQHESVFVAAIRSQ
jgi:hypothetical protein